MPVVFRERKVTVLKSGSWENGKGLRERYWTKGEGKAVLIEKAP
jgi:hypothetical protein